MKNYSIILFDLDGTLGDSGPGIRKCLARTFVELGLEEPTTAELNRFIGPPLEWSFRNYYNIVGEQNILAGKTFRRIYDQDGLYDNDIYKGMPELLATLKNAGKKLYVTTSKPEKIARKVLEHFDIAKYFEYIGGSDPDNGLETKTDVIKYVFEKCNLSPEQNIVIVGDREHDIIGAKNVGIDSIGVLYGYGSREEHEKAGADYVAPTVKDIEKIILEN